MRAYCNATTVLATHDDHQMIDPALYGDGVDVVMVPDGYEFARLGEWEPDTDRGETGTDDPRPLARPELTDEQRRAGLPALSPRQMRLVMLSLGMTDYDVTARIEQIEDETERAAALIDWQWATRYERLHPLVVQLAADMEFEPLQFDALWAYAMDL